MADKLIQLADDFWNIRGVFKIGGVANIGTHCSLVRQKNGKFLLLDAYTLNDEIKQQVYALTNNGDDVDAILNLHPFHTVHVERSHKQFPNAKLYGTARHIERATQLPWQPELVESPEAQALFAEDLIFSIPAGVDFISANENVHFSSVLAFHKSSRTLHVDDTLMLLRPPKPLNAITDANLLGFHPTLAKALEPRSGAANDFRGWAKQLASDMSGCENLCAAHVAIVQDCSKRGENLSPRLLKALKRVEKTLRAHEKKFG